MSPWKYLNVKILNCMPKKKKKNQATMSWRLLHNKQPFQKQARYVEWNGWELSKGACTTLHISLGKARSGIYNIQRKTTEFLHISIHPIPVRLTGNRICPVMISHLLANLKDEYSIQVIWNNFQPKSNISLRKMPIKLTFRDL